MKVRMHGSLPVKLEKTNELVAMDFTIDTKIDRAEMDALLKENDAGTETYWNQRAPLTQYGELRAIKKITI